MFGWPGRIQLPMQMECETASGGIDLYADDEDENAMFSAYDPHGFAGDWRLLLQLDSEDALGWMWGDAGRLYFWIREPDLAACRFDRTWLVLQCY